MSPLRLFHRRLQIDQSTIGQAPAATGRHIPCCSSCTITVWRANGNSPSSRPTIGSRPALYGASRTRRRVMWRELMWMASTGRNCPAQEAEGGCSMVLLVGQWVSLSLRPMHLGAYRPRSDANSWPQLPNAALLSILLRLATNSRRGRVTPSTFPPPISGRRSSGWAVKGRPGMPAMALIRAELPSWRKHRLTPHVGVTARGVAVRSAI